jgi:hypothetical protein
MDFYGWKDDGIAEISTDVQTVNILGDEILWRDKS